MQANGSDNTVEDRNDVPRGFAGAFLGWQWLAQADGLRVLRLPSDGIRDGAFTRLPDGEFDAIFVEGFVESLGSFEPFVADATARLAPGGALYLDVLHEQSPRQLRRTLEGRPNGLDPLGSFGRPEIAMSAARLIDAVVAVPGLHIDDLLRLPHADRLDGAGHGEFVRSMIEHGLMASAYAGGTPAARLWLCATHLPERLPQRADVEPVGTVVIGTGASDAIETTRTALSQFLPATWEIVCRDQAGLTEHASLNRGVHAARGEKVWFLRAGSRPTASAFAALVEAALFGPAVLANSVGDQPAAPGDLSGLLCARRDLLLVGPVDESWRSEIAAYEDYGMRIEAMGLPISLAQQTVPNALVQSPPPVMSQATRFLKDDDDPVAVLEREFAAMVERWDGVGNVDDPLLAAALRGRAVDTPPPPWDGREPRVTLCMITRDEEQFLDQCLRRAAPVVDEIIVVDTGSTDRTIEIARAHGATVLQQAWQDDFSKPRNLGLEAATGDWILVLDADELLEEGAAQELRRAVSDPFVCGYHLRFTNVFGEDATLGVTMVRLFRNLPALTWHNRIHEQITPSLLVAAHESGLVLASADVHVLHYGYQPEVMDARNKLARNERLFELQLRDHPDDIYSLYKYGDFLRRCPGRDADARATLERTFELILERHPACPRGIPYAGEVAALCALEHAREHDYLRAERVLELAFRRFMATPNLHYIAAGIALRRGREDEAIAHYQCCLRYRDQTLVVPIQTGITSFVSLVGIAQAWLQKGQPERARRLLESAIRIEPSYDVAAMVLSRLHLDAGDAKRATQTLTDYVAEHPDSAGANQQLALLLAQLGYHDQARRVGDRAVDLLEADASTSEAKRMKTTMAALT